MCAHASRGGLDCLCARFGGTGRPVTRPAACAHRWRHWPSATGAGLAVPAAATTPTAGKAHKRVAIYRVPHSAVWRTTGSESASLRSGPRLSAGCACPRLGAHRTDGTSDVRSQYECAWVGSSRTIRNHRSRGAPVAPPCVLRVVCAMDRLRRADAPQGALAHLRAFKRENGV